MPRVLSRGGTAVVAIGAIPRDIPMVEASVAPSGDDMAIVTFSIALDMVGRFAFYPEVVVATLASSGGTGKHSVQMAAVAGHVPMTAGKRETGGEVVVFAGRGK